MTLTDFLLARIGEDEAVAQQWPEHSPAGQHPDGGMWMDAYGHPVYQPRTRVLADCEAKRQIVFQYEFADRAAGGDPAYQLPAAMLRTALSHLALPYADHDDYREEWR